MFKYRLRINLTERKNNRDITLSDTKFMQKSLGIIIILLFTINQKKDFVKAMKRGADGIFTDNPYITSNCFKKNNFNI